MPPPRPRPPRRPRADRVGLALAWVAVVVVGAGALASLDPARVGLSMLTPWAQLVTLRAAAGALALALAVLLALVAAAVRVRRRRRLRRWPVPLLVLVACLAVTGVGQGAVLLARTPPPALGAAGDGRPLPGRQPGDLVVTTFNVGPRGTPADEVVDLALRRDADVVALTEAPEELAQQVADGLAAAGRPVQLLSAAPVDGPALRLGGTGLLLPFVEANTRLLVSEDLGRYTAVGPDGTTSEGTTSDGTSSDGTSSDGTIKEEAGPGVPAPPRLLGGAVVAVPADGDGPPLAAVHTLPALPLLFDMGRWRSETAAAVGLCDRLPGGVVAGDLNVTPDHAVLRTTTCVDAAAGEGLHGGDGPDDDGADDDGGGDDGGGGADAPGGTWPSSLPVPLTAPIDHVLADAGSWSAVDAAVDRVGASDHRALTALLRPRPTG
ncbi:endonuclease/exonuclease/phosphatase family protein [Pseudokineococcus basanitobsidens]|uniref:Endonuclease/exonuclease/phosphatase family protein n=1 Tax=Pseudokineococcus basanitobsidens TaxID=1926649 RepID=A0ABU8RM80_9ACTN